MDLCAGSHVRYTKQVKAFKLLSIAGAYHRGDEKYKQLQRIYGTAFASKDELAQYLDRQEQAKLRDHRKLGKDLQLFHIDEDVGQGLILWTPRGAILRQELQNFISDELRKQGYFQVFTPTSANSRCIRPPATSPTTRTRSSPPLSSQISSPRSPPRAAVAPR